MRTDRAGGANGCGGNGPSSLKRAKTPTASLLATLLVVLLAALSAAFAAYDTVLSVGLRQLEVQADERAQLIAATIRARLERFGYLPEVVARSQEIEALFSPGAGAQTLETGNAVLARIRTVSGALALFVTDASGLTLAASNHGKATSFVGQNYSFRPYFQKAVTEGAGHAYAVGATTGEPGYFLSTAIRHGQQTTGVAIVKIDLLGLEQQWRDAGEWVAVQDADGVIFLSSDPDWRYRATTTLTAAGLETIEREKRYGDVPIKPVPWSGPAAGRGESQAVVVSEPLSRERAERLLRKRPLGVSGWTLLYLADPGAAGVQARIAALTAVLAVFLIAAGIQIISQRRSAARLERRTRTELESRVVERTGALMAANRRLADEIAERQQVERDLDTTRGKLMQAEKLAIIGQALTGVAHEINQPLAALRTYLSSTKLLVQRGNGSAVQENMDLMGSVVDRVSELTSELKDVARRQGGTFGRTDLVGVLRRMVALLKFRFSDLGIDVSVDMTDSMPVNGNRAQLEQAVLNLLSNAIDSVGHVEGPRIVIGLSRAGERCRLAISDNGPGVDGVIAARLFEPFYTTKEQGLGLGLSVVRKIVDDHHGTLSIDRSSLGGAAVIITLPLFLKTLPGAE